MIYCFDLDHTICNTKRTKNGWDYKNAKPLPGAVKKLKELKDNGNEIIILTARHMLSCNNNIQLIEKIFRKSTEEWLKKNEIPYDRLIFGKPYADVYVDDKAFNFKNDWNNVNFKNIENLLSCYR